jgi:hypothetical protein
MYSWIAVSLTLKQGLTRNNGTLQLITVDEARKGVKRLMKVLNTATYGKAARRYSKRLAVLPTFERGSSGRLHIHMLLECHPWDVSKFTQLIEHTWETYPWGHKQKDIRPLSTPQDVENWTRYILKDVRNGVPDVIDYENLLTPWQRDEVIARKYRPNPMKKREGHSLSAKRRPKSPSAADVPAQIPGSTTCPVTSFEVD